MGMFEWGMNTLHKQRTVGPNLKYLLKNGITYDVFELDFRTVSFYAIVPIQKYFFETLWTNKFRMF